MAVDETVSEQAMGRVDAPDEILDALGLECPQPVLQARRVLDRMRDGRVLEVRADDPLAELDLRVFCERCGHEFLGGTEAGRHRRFRIRKRDPGCAGEDLSQPG